MITIQEANQAMKAGTTVRGTDKHGNTHEGTINAIWKIAPTGYKQMGRVLPANAPEGDWETIVDITFPISDQLQSGATYTLQDLEIVEPEPAVEEAATPAKVEITSIQLSTGHTHVWDEAEGVKRIIEIVTSYDHAIWYVPGEGDAVGTTYVAITNSQGHVLIIYVVEIN